MTTTSTSGRAGRRAAPATPAARCRFPSFKTDGYRQHSAADIRQLNAGVDYTVFGHDHRHSPLQRRRRPDGGESRRTHPRRISRQSRLGGGHQHRSPRRQGCPAAAALTRPQACGQRWERARGNGVRAPPRSQESARGASSERARSDDRHLRHDRPRRWWRPSSAAATCSDPARVRRGCRRERMCSGCATTGRTSAPIVACPRTAC